MKEICLLFIISLFINDVFGDETVRVSVNDGGSVTLHTHTNLKGDEMMEWRFKGKFIAKINREVNGNPVYDSDERFTDRLKMNPQTGDLTITHITSEHTGDYQLEIINGEIKTKTFSVGLSLKVKTVIKGDSVSLHIDVTDEQRKDKIYWRIKHKNSLVAEIITENGRVTKNEAHNGFRGILKLDEETGDVIITNMKEEDSGEYEADVTINNTHTIHNTFTYTAPEVSARFSKGKDDGSSSVKIALIVATVAAAAATVGVILIIKHHQDAITQKRLKDISELLRNGVSNGDVLPV